MAIRKRKHVKCLAFTPHLAHAKPRMELGKTDRWRSQVALCGITSVSKHENPSRHDHVPNQPTSSRSGLVDCDMERHSTESGDTHT